MSWIEEYRTFFPAAQKCTYLDCAYDCGGSKLGRRATERYFDDWAEAAIENERGGPGRTRFFAVADETREMLGKMLGGVSGSQIAFSRNTNEGINVILQGFDFRQGENLVIHSLDHDSVIMPALNARQRRGVSLKIVETDKRVISAEDLMDAVDEHTRMMAVSHVQPATGYRIDMEKLGGFCRERGIYLVVDAIQSIGIQPFYAQRWGVDAVSGASYKWLGGINSMGFFYISERLARRVAPVYVAAGPYMDYVKDKNGFHLVCTDMSKARKFENSSLDNPGIYALHDGAAKLLEIGLDQIAMHVETLVLRLLKGLKKQGWNVMTPEDAGKRCSIVSVLPTDKETVFRHFRNHNIALSISGGTYIRFGIAPFTTWEDVDHVLAAAETCPVR